MGNATNLRVTRDNLVALPVLAPYFILGLLSFLAAPALLLVAAPALESGLHRHPYMLAAVHLYALGWGTAVALGAIGFSSAHTTVAGKCMENVEM